LKPISGNPPVQQLKAFTWIDSIIIVVLLAATVIALPLMHSSRSATVIVFNNNQIIARYPLAQDKFFTIQGDEGPMSLEIKNNAVSVTASSCKRHLCMKTGTIRYPYQQIVCAPNHVIVTIGSPEKSRIDAIAQ
jgi:hypothetical protein